MKRKTEDQILQLAFEEMTPELAAAYERDALLDPEASCALADYRQIKADLRMLADIPPDQLSKERLREAILDRGLKPKPVRRTSWAWMPMTAAAVAAAAFLLRPHPPVSTRVAIGPRQNIFSIPKVATPGDSAVAGRVAPPASSEEIDVPTAAMRAAIYDPSSRHSSTRRHHLRTDIQIGTGDMKEFDLTANISPQSSVTPPTGKTSSPSGADSQPAASTPSAPIVLIDSEKDGSTGASKATEVNSTSNVVVGG